MNKITQYTKSLVLFILIACCFMTSGCSTFADRPNNKEVPVTSTGVDNESSTDKFYRRNTELINAVETHNIARGIKKARDTLRKGRDFKLFWFIPVNISTEGLSYHQKFLEEENGVVDIVVDEKGRGNIVLSVLF